MNWMIPITLVALCLTGGCDEPPAAKPAASSRPVRTGTGTIRGTVTLVGRVPNLRTPVDEPCCNGKATIVDETLTADEVGHLRDVVVYLEDAPGAEPASPPPVVLDQTGCRYVPHVLALRVGQTLRVKNSDPTIHNVHGMCEKNRAFNFAETVAGQTRDLTFSEPESFTVRCDVHPWMRAQVTVFDHPWFAVTGADGAFHIEHVPPGSYTLVAWQEKYGEIRLPVSADDGKVVEINPTFETGLR